MITNIVPTDPRERREWIKFHLRLRGTSFADIARSLGVSRTAPHQAFYQPYPRMERALAEALDLPPQALFPERYDDHGQPNRPMGRRKLSNHVERDHTTPAAACNDEHAVSPELFDELTASNDQPTPGGARS